MVLNFQFLMLLLFLVGLAMVAVGQQNVLLHKRGIMKWYTKIGKDLRRRGLILGACGLVGFGLASFLDWAI
jgi:hypothetical protein